MAIYVSLSGYTSNITPVSFNINNLIREAIPAFSTSIIGIIGAIISTIINRWVSDVMERADNEQFLNIKTEYSRRKNNGKFSRNGLAGDKLTVLPSFSTGMSMGIIIR